jgi:hypothetical protein
MKYKLVERAKYYAIYDTERDVVVLTSSNRALCIKLMELYNARPTSENNIRP